MALVFLDKHGVLDIGPAPDPLLPVAALLIDFDHMDFEQTHPERAARSIVLSKAGATRAQQTVDFLAETGCMDLIAMFVFTRKRISEGRGGDPQRAPMRRFYYSDHISGTRRCIDAVWYAGGKDDFIAGVAWDGPLIFVDDQLNIMQAARRLTPHLQTVHVPRHRDRALPSSASHRTAHDIPGIVDEVHWLLGY
jgi:hypothetical protein